MLWGTHAFIGTIFTNAPVDAEAIDEIRNVLNETGGSGGDNTSSNNSNEVDDNQSV